jgi:uncharacterized membrane protein YphA (DoxX/SURF4 family)
MKYVSIIGRYLFALPFFIFGINNIVYIEKSAKSVPAYMPNPVIWAYIVGGALILGSIMFAINKFLPIVGSLLAVMLLCLAFMVHFPNLMHPETVQMAMIGFLKDISLAGAALFIGFNSGNKA